MMTDSFFIVSSLGHEITLWLLLILSIISLAVALEKWVLLSGWKKSTRRAVAQTSQAIESGSLEWIKNLSDEFSNSKKDPGTALVSSYLDNEPELITDVFQSFALSKKNEFESRLSLLATIGSNAPFIGLLGTIFGVMDAFHALGASGQASAPIVMMGIAKALLATAVGLIVAIPSILFYNFLRRQTRVILHHFEYIEKAYALYTRSAKHKKQPSLASSDPETEKSEIETTKLV